MPYTRPYAGGFVDYPSTTTPINSTALNTMDVGIKTANDQFQSVTTAQRAALTPTVGQCVWDSDLKQLMVFMNASGGNAWQPIGNRIVCTSTTRPSSPFHGQVVYETDTKKELTYNGSSWVQTNSASTTSGVTGVSNLIVPPTAKAVGATASVANGTNTYCTFTTGTEWDTDGMFSSGANSRLTINTAGVYLLSTHIAFQNGTTGFRFVAFVVNNSLVYTVADLNTNTTADPWEFAGSDQLYLSAGSYVQVRVFHTQGSALNVTYNSLAATWIGRTS